MFPKVPQSSLGILSVPQLPPPLVQPPPEPYNHRAKGITASFPASAFALGFCQNRRFSRERTCTQQLPLRSMWVILPRCGLPLLASLWVNLQLSRLPQAPLGLNWMTASNFLAISGQLHLRAVHRLSGLVQPTTHDLNRTVNGPSREIGRLCQRSLPSFHPFHFGWSPSSTLMFGTYNLMQLGNRVFGFALGIRLRFPVF